MEISSDMMLEAISGLMVIDTAGKVVYINEACADYIKVNREKSIGKDINEVFPPSTMKNMLKGEKRFNIQYYFTEGRMSASSQFQLRKNGKVVGVLEYDMLEEVEQLDYFLEEYSGALKDEIKYFREQTRKFEGTKYSINNIIGSSQKVKDLKEQIEIAAMSTSTVLIQGETGTGKELVAHAIHNLSARAFNDFVKVNAAGMSESLIESELFGYVGGAFTGAKTSGKKGKFELADRGTLFIDEINHMPPAMQPKLLRALQEGEISPVGSEEDIDVDVRVIAASNEKLEQLVLEDKFRADLYYRLNVFTITVPPLRERIDDIPELVKQKVHDINKEMGKNITKIDPDVYEALAEYDWPGNVRELYNRVESAMNYVQGDTLQKIHFNFRADNSKINLEALKTTDNPIEAIKHEAEWKLINETLLMFDNNKTKAAEYLKISRPLLYQKMKRLGID
ncbi:MAG: sigma 54-interacting transcriptional regulator [Bacillota bacterium]|nr:sigma 54-interacting transcriptional regulator [Bacillota bacterium]